MRIAQAACVLLAVVAVSSAPADADSAGRVTVSAGDVDRIGAPVSATIKLPRAMSGAVVTLKADGAAPVEAQLFTTSDGQTELFWIEPNLPAKQTRAYELNINKGEARSGFTFTENAQDGCRDLSYAGKNVLRYMHRYDPADHANTFKPFHHVFDFDGKDYITKGPGGLYTHHRGIFFGFNKTQYGDFWHCPDVSQRHEKFIAEREFAGPVAAREVEVINWVGKDGAPVARDTRQVTTWRISPPSYAFDYVIKLEALKEDGLKLDGDPQHAGLHFRAAQEVAEGSSGNRGGKATYVRPAGAQFTRNDEWLTTPWAACSFTVKDKPYTVVILDPTENPKPGTFSTRPYGRFGAFFKGEVAKDKPLTLRYRVIVVGGAAPDEPVLSRMNADFDTPAKVTLSN